MHFVRSPGLQVSSKGLLGLIDGTQAIVLTLLVIELPALLIRAVDNVSGYNLVWIVATDILGYLLIAIIIYDIWSIQRSLVDCTEASRKQNVVCLITLFISTLIPPFVYLSEHFAQARFFESSNLSEGVFEVLVFRTALSLTMLCNYLVLLFYANAFNVADKNEA